MDPVAKDVPESAISEAWGRHMLALFCLFGKSPTVDYAETPLFARWHASLPHPYFEGVQVFQPPPEQMAAFIQEQIAYFQARGVKFLCWWLRPPLVNADWQDALYAQGFTLDQGVPWMALVLDELPDTVRRPDGLEIRVVDDKAALDVWIDTFARGYELQPEWKEPLAGIYQALGCDLPLRHYIAFLQGAPLAAASLFLAEGVAGIWNVATVKETRGQGLGSAIVWQALRDARQMGYSIAALESSKMGYPVYRRLGFRDIFCPGNFAKTL